jgi:hypothetical protein
MVAQAEPGQGGRRGDNAGELEPKNERWNYEAAVIVLVLATSVEKVDMVEAGMGDVDQDFVGRVGRRRGDFGDLQVGVVLYKALDGYCFHLDASSGMILCNG